MALFRCPRVVWQYETSIHFPAVKQVAILKSEDENSTFLNERVARQPLVVSISQISEELRLYKLVINVIILYQNLYLQMHSLAERFAFFFFLGDNRGFLEEGVET